MATALCIIIYFSFPLIPMLLCSKDTFIIRISSYDIIYISFMAMIMTTDIFSVLQFDTAWLPLLHFKFVFFIKIMNKRTFFQQGIVHCL